MLLYIARHAWAGHYGDPGWPSDSLRELTADGAERYRGVVATLADRGLAPTRIATSPYTRCVQTARILAEQSPGDPPVDELDALAPGSELREILEWSRAHGDGDLAWVGHNPDVERLLAVMIGDAAATIRFAKGAIAAVRFDDGPPRRGDGVLQWHVTAKSLGR